MDPTTVESTMGINSDETVNGKKCFFFKLLCRGPLNFTSIHTFADMACRALYAVLTWLYRTTKAAYNGAELNLQP